MKEKGKKITIVLLLLLTVIAATTLTFGKYIYNSVWNYYLKSKGFYFESDLLEINKKNNSLLKWNGSDIYFTLKNSLNNELISEYDISYKLTCIVLGDEANYIDCVINGTNSNTFNGSLSNVASCVNNVDSEDVSSLTKVDCELNGYTWHDEVTIKNNYFNLVLKDESKNIDEVSVKIIAESIKPYNKTLVGIFNINKIDSENTELETYYQSFSEHDELSITNKSTSDKCMQLSFGSSNYLFDLDETEVENYSTDSDGKINKINVKIEKSSSVIYKFYKINDGKQYSINDFTIEEKEC